MGPITKNLTATEITDAGLRMKGAMALSGSFEQQSELVAKKVQQGGA